MNKEAIVFVKHILESIEQIEKYIKGKNKQQFIEDKKLQDAIIRRIEIIGEAAKNIPTSFKDKYPEISWQQIIGTRDKLIHHYFGVDLDLTFEILNKDLPKLKEQINEILKEEY